MGLVILASIFLVSFTSSQSLYSNAQPLLSNVGAIQQSGVFRIEAADYVTIIVFILLVIAGVVGVFPLGAGVVGVVAMAMYTVGPYLIYPGGAAPSYDVGFYLVWAASIISLGASFWHGRRDKKVVVNNQVNVSAPAASRNDVPRLINYIPGD